MASVKDLTGQRFEKLVVLRREGSKFSHAQWVCQCDCGNQSLVLGCHLTSGNTTSCGCMKHVKILVDIDWNDPASRNVRRRELYTAKVEAGYKRIRSPEYREQKSKRQKRRYYEDIEAARANARKRCRTYRERHPDAASAAYHRRRAFVLNSPRNDLTGAQWHEIKNAYGHRCVYCGRKMQRLTQDHIIPLSKGGAHTASNIVPACMSCNCSKAAGAVPVPVQPLLFLVNPPSPRA